jgi:hypothetical protein
MKFYKCLDNKRVGDMVFKANISLNAELMNDSVNLVLFRTVRSIFAHDPSDDLHV